MNLTQFEAELEDLLRRHGLKEYVPAQVITDHPFWNNGAINGICLTCEGIAPEHRFAIGRDGATYVLHEPPQPNDLGLTPYYSPISPTAS